MSGIPGNQKSESALNASPLIGTERSCRKCLLLKTIDSFYLHYGEPRFICKKCTDITSKKWKAANKERNYATNRRWKAANKERNYGINRRSYEKNKNVNKEKKRESNKRWYEKNKDRARELINKWEKEHPESRRNRRRQMQQKIRCDVRRRLDNTMRRSIWESIKRHKNGKKWVDLVGYDVKELKKHLQKYFTKEMTWNNYGTYWHIDHKIPISAFNFEKPENIDFKRCWALDNLQPMEAKENIKKSNKINKPFQPALRLG